MTVCAGKQAAAGTRTRPNVTREGRYPLKDKPRAFVKCDFDGAINGGGGLQLRAGDVVYVLDQQDSGWWGGHKQYEDRTGWFPATFVELQPLDKCSVDSEDDEESEDEENNTRQALEDSLHGLPSPSR